MEPSFWKIKCPYSYSQLFTSCFPAATNWFLSASELRKCWLATKASITNSQMCALNQLCAPRHDGRDGKNNGPRLLIPSDHLKKHFQRKTNLKWIWAPLTLQPKQSLLPQIWRDGHEAWSWGCELRNCDESNVFMLITFISLTCGNTIWRIFFGGRGLPPFRPKNLSNQVFLVKKIFTIYCYPF